MRWLQASPVGHFMRESSDWTYAVVNLIHILGIALLFGAIILLDLRLLGVWRSIPLAHLARPAVTIARTGVVMAALSGILLISTNTSDYIGNTFLLIKFGFIGLALANVVLMHRSSAWQAHHARVLTLSEERQLAVMGGASIFFWLGAITCGRMIAYW